MGAFFAPKNCLMIIWKVHMIMLIVMDVFLLFYLFVLMVLHYFFKVCMPVVVRAVNGSSITGFSSFALRNYLIFFKSDLCNVACLFFSYCSLLLIPSISVPVSCTETPIILLAIIVGGSFLPPKN